MEGEWLLVIPGVARDVTEGDPRAHDWETATTRLFIDCASTSFKKNLRT